MRKKTKIVYVGGVPIGGGQPVVVQSMCNTKTTDVSATVLQVTRLAAAGCELVRLAVKDEADAKALGEIKKRLSETVKRDQGAEIREQKNTHHSSLINNNSVTRYAIPLIADIHYDTKLAIAAIDAGADKVRLNPGNTKDFWQAIDYAKEKGIPVRIGFNSGSSNGFDFSILEKIDYDQVILAAKSSDVLETIEGYRKLSGLTKLPLHVGVTEAGTLLSGSIKSAVGIGTLLAEGIGDTIRVSLAGDPVKEVEVAYKILGALGLRKRGVEVIACPTCGRTEIDVEKLALEVEDATKHIVQPLKIAVMGCAVNGPGEAKHADFGVAGGKGEGLLFARGEIVKKVAEDKIVEELLKILEK
ncbi:MAG: flavodoxin/ferredoxin-dependent (E)-4-hydroxy-3-methylbut-2-enyl-diphosphate synthase [Candidatus Margulisiibacteriota bacterium]